MRVRWRHLCQCDPGTDGETRQCEAGERDRRPVVGPVEVVVAVDPATVGEDAETDGYRGETADERQRRPYLEAVLCDFLCSHPGGEDAGRYRGRGCPLSGGHRPDDRRGAKKRGDTVPRTAAGTGHAVTCWACCPPSVEGVTTLRRPLGNPRRV